MITFELRCKSAFIRLENPGPIPKQRPIYFGFKSFPMKKPIVYSIAVKTRKYLYLLLWTVLTLFMGNVASAQIDFVVNSAVFSPTTISIGETATLTTNVSINPTSTAGGGQLAPGCLEIVISMPAPKQYVPQGGAAAVSAMGFGASFTWTYSAIDNSLYGYNNVNLPAGSGGNIVVTVQGLAITGVPAISTVNASDFANCTITNDGSNDSRSTSLSVVHSVELSCITDTVFFYDVTSMGIVIRAEDLYNSASTTPACEPLSFFLFDSIRREPDSLVYGLNDLFDPPTCIVLTAKDDCGDSLNCKILISILDTLPPQIFCPLPDTVCDLSQVPLPFATLAEFEAAGGDVSDETFSVFIPASFFSWIGDDTTSAGCNRTIERKYRIEDWFGNADTCSQFFVVKNANGLSCGPTVTKNTDPGLCTAAIQVSAQINANCEVDTFFNNGPVNNIYPLGTTNVTFTLITECIDTFKCIKQVIVSDSIFPVLRCPSDVTVQCTVPAAAVTFAQYTGQGGLAVDNCAINTSSITSIDSPAVGTCPRTVVRTYFISDQSGNSSSCQQSITLNDTTPPMITDPADITAGTDNGVCQAVVNLINPTVTDNCNMGTTLVRIPAGNVFQAGVTVVTWTATDACGNTSTQTQSITVLDDEAPNLNCKGPLDLNLSYGDNYKTALSLLLSYTDNCPASLTVKARRMDVVCASNGNQWLDTVRFCCADVNLTRQVIVRVTDAAGNSNTCMVAITVKDKLAPVLEEPLPNITISCDYDIQLNDLEDFGTIVFDPADRAEIDIDDTLFVGPKYDGWVTDNCPGSLQLNELTPLDQRGPHNNGNIIRRFVVTDGAGNTLAVNQTITIIDADPLTLDDIHWPADTSYTDCTAIPPDTSLTGSPVFDNDDICTLPAASFKDQVFDDPTSGCVYIRRKWRVIDWAQYIPNTTTGVWEHIQDIHLINSVKPVFTSSCADRTVCAVNAECDAVVRLGAHATDDCTEVEDLTFDYKIDTDNNGSIDHYATDDTFAIRLPRGIHKISWRVEDRCGNFTDCSYLVTVKECKAPTPVCLYGLSTNLEDNGTGGTSVIWAKDFNNHSYDNCTSEAELKFSFTSNTANTSLTLTCANEGIYNLSMWVTDKDGNQARCNTFIKVTDNKNLCPDTIGGNGIPGLSVAGRIVTEEQAMLKGIKVSLTDQTNAMWAETDETGNYMIENVLQLGDYQLKPQKNDEWQQGISTIDLVMIQRHILNAARLTSPYKLIAADANNDQKISASDLVALRKLILGLETEIAGNTSWRFVPKSFQFADPSQPWPFAEIVELNDIDVNLMNNDFFAIKTGDVNGTVSNSIKKGAAENRTRKLADLVIKEQYFEAGKFVNVPVTLDHNGSFTAIQTGIKIDTRNLEFAGIMDESIALPKESYRYDLNTGMLYIAHLESTPVELRPGAVLFILQFKTIERNKLSKVLSLETAAYENFLVDVNIEPVYLNVRMSDDLEALTVSQNTPNPFADYTEVKYFIADDGMVEITIYDNAGSKIFNQVRHCTAGVNQLRIDREQLGDKRGVFFLHIATGERKEIKKLLRLN